VTVKSIDLAATGRAETIRADFDRIAAVQPDATPDASTRHVEELLTLLPARIGNAIDLGCGTGGLARRLAERADHVVGVDLSPRMIALAREGAAHRANIEWRIGDFMTETLRPASFDAVSSVATLHHLPLRAALGRAAELVRPGGWLLVVDLFEPAGIGGFVQNASWWLLSRWRSRHRPEPSREAREAWRAHERNDRIPMLAEIRTAAASLPGARLTVRPLWRWTLAWHRPAST
jgi:SAM-dependent methyltransferase